MAGLFQVLYGDGKGGFGKPKPLTGNDGEPLILPMREGQKDVISRICTRPFACDLDGDGKLDIVSGNFRGTFGWFKGEGNGAFAATATWLEADGKTMQVGHHSDPFLIDWDGDHDLDLLSGSSDGGAFLFVNQGTKTEPRFGKRITLLPCSRRAGTHEQQPNEGVTFGDAHLDGPSGDTRVCAADVDGDGKLDLLIGDQVGLVKLATGVDATTARAKLEQWDARMERLIESSKDLPRSGPDSYSNRYQALIKQKQEFAIDDRTGFVWLLKQK